MAFRPAPKPLLVTISESRALDCMRDGSALVHMHGKSSEKHWFIVPGGPVDDKTSERIRARPDVVGQKDGLFPNHDQTWRMH